MLTDKQQDCLTQICKWNHDERLDADDPKLQTVYAVMCQVASYTSTIVPAAAFWLDHARINGYRVTVTEIRELAQAERAVQELFLMHGDERNRMSGKLGRDAKSSVIAAPQPSVAPTDQRFMEVAHQLTRPNHDEWCDLIDVLDNLIKNDHDVAVATFRAGMESLAWATRRELLGKFVTQILHARRQQLIATLPHAPG